MDRDRSRSEARRHPLPVVVVTGYLGAGKTCLVNALLRRRDRRLAVVVNEFGELGIDGSLVHSAARSVVELPDGCVCCSVSDALSTALRDVASSHEILDAVVLETSGLAHPGPVLASMLESELRERVVVECVVTVVDAANFDAHALEPGARDQIARGDVLVLNKLDLVGPEKLAALHASLRAQNPSARIVRSVRGDVAWEVLMPRPFERSAPREATREHTHETDIDCVALRVRRDVRAAAVITWLGELSLLRGDEIFRLKGVASLPARPDGRSVDGWSPRRLVVQGVHRHLDVREARTRGGVPGESRFVFMGRRLDRGLLAEGLRKCLTA